MRKSAVILLSLLLVIPAGSGGPNGDAETRARAVAPFLDELTIAVAHVDLSRIDFKAAAARLTQLGFTDKKELTMAQQLARTWQQDFLQAGGKSLFVVSSLAGRVDRVAIIVPRARNTDAEAIGKLLELLPEMQVRREKNAILAGPTEVLARLAKEQQPAERKELAAALAAAGDAPVQIAFLPPPIFVKALQETLPDLPKALGGQPIEHLSRGVRWGAVGAQPGPEMAMRLVIQADDAAAAKRMEQFLGKLLPLIAKEAGRHAAAEGLGKLLEQLRPRAQGDRLTLNLDEKTLTTVFVPLIKKGQAAALRTVSTNNLKQLALAMHNYHDVHKGLPAPAKQDAQGKPLLSWRVLILPYIEQEELYKEFKLDEPWDSEHNKKLIARIPDIYRSPYQKGKSDGKTPYLVPVGKDTMFPGGKGLHLREIVDGTSNTIMIVEASEDHEVIWTKPDDLKVSAKAPLAGLGRAAQSGFPAAYGDGSVRYLSKTIDSKLLHALFTRNGGEVVSEH